MKKTYNKPVIMYEGFTLNNAIAANCEKIITTSTEGVCGEKFGKGNELFFDGITQCTVILSEGVPDDSTGYDGACYHNPSVENNLYTS